MPLIPLAVALLIVFALVGALPLLLVLRYRFGTSRRLGRGWVARLNLVMMSLSAGLFLVSAAIVNFWIPATFKYSVAGLIARYPRLARAGRDPLGADAASAALYSKPLAGIDHHRGCNQPTALRLPAKLARMGRDGGRTRHVGACGIGNLRLPGGRSYRPWLLSHLFSGRLATADTLPQFNPGGYTMRLKCITDENLRFLRGRSLAAIKGPVYFPLIAFYRIEPIENVRFDFAMDTVPAIPATP